MWGKFNSSYNRTFPYGGRDMKVVVVVVAGEGGGGS